MSVTERAAQLTEGELDARLRAGIGYANYFNPGHRGGGDESHANAVAGGAPG